ncbi:Sugar phosphate isomerase/epimerase [Candidatus Koribacter versatilis Ellin345]|uniref:Sugar phosphate isomerase/epimerase n=1 Tax=Koribacter versatilis (strain Ellin345) TaxID=204669 RepID=Q1IR04_KORVE|nr:sugar phosphate isomerase/epimerase [Candidatus Koribacter versatilis]ABF40696.1 Sugar phosphate isomerase/epimerase [Candidatus Koribacter versatilis Ellin345]
MVNRRDFLKTAVASLAADALPLRALGAEGPSIGLQLYTVRKQAQSALPSVLARIRQIGYEEVETYWNLYKHPAPELLKMIGDAGLRVPSGHFDYEKVEQSFDYAHQLGLQYMVCPMLPKTMQNRSLDDFKRAAQQFNKWGEKAKQAGMRFAFHNHNYEFQRFGEQTGYDVLLSETDPKLVWFELDCYWLTQAGGAPVEMIHRLGSRVKLLHIKDRLPGVATSQKLGKPAEHFTEVGTGTLDFKAIAEAARAVGVEHYFVEQDTIIRPVYESLQTSYEGARRLLSE